MSGTVRVSLVNLDANKSSLISIFNLMKKIQGFIALTHLNLRLC